MQDWSPVPFEQLEGWPRDDHLAALSCFRMSARALRDQIAPGRQGLDASSALHTVAARALDLDSAGLTSIRARAFFESSFMPHTLTGQKGFVTAYFEPEVMASRQRTDEFPAPLYRRPTDLVKVTDENRPPRWPATLEYARYTTDGLVEFHDRAAIEAGALAGKDLELVWLRSSIEAFYIHVQGSARLKFLDGSTVRVGYAGKTGHPYTSIGKELVRRGVMSAETANMENIRAWLEADRARAADLMNRNRSFIFFAEIENQNPDFGPRAAAGVQLTAGRSLAVDRTVHAYGTPVWIATDHPLPHDSQPFRRLMIAQDTGSAIVGPQRGDIFMGSGPEAGMLAGAVRHDTRFVVLRPR